MLVGVGGLVVGGDERREEWTGGEWRSRETKNAAGLYK
jgi:hypothetical protein